MPKKSRTPSNTAATALLDVDWLAGKRSDPRLRLPKSKASASMLGTTLSVTALFVVIASIVGLWSPLSQRWLREQGASLLNLGNSSADENLAMLVSLNELGQYEAESQASFVNTLPASSGAPVSGLGTNVGAASFLSATPVAPSTKGNVMAQPKSASLPAKASAGTTLSNTGRLSDEHDVPPPPFKSDAFAKPTGRLTDSAVSSLTDHPPGAQSSGDNKGKIVGKSVEFKRSQSKPAVIIPVEHAIAEAATTNQDLSPHDDLKHLTIERLFPLLASTQERRVRLVCDELSQRGIPNSLLELSVQLARGDEILQLEILDRLSVVSDVSPAPVLYWMAQSGRRSVRKRAIAILGSLQDRDVVQQLRFLATREPDSSLRQLIEQTVASNFGVVK